MHNVPKKFWEPIELFMREGRTGSIEIVYKEGCAHSCKFVHQVGVPRSPRPAGVVPQDIEKELAKLMQFSPRGSVRLNIHQGAVLNADFSYHKPIRQG